MYVQTCVIKKREYGITKNGIYGDIKEKKLNAIK